MASVAADVSSNISDIKRKLEAIRRKAEQAMSLAESMGADMASGLAKGTQGMQVGNEGLADLNDVIRGLDPASLLAGELKDVQVQALSCNTAGSSTVRTIGEAGAHAVTAQNVGQAALARLDGVIANLPRLAAGARPNGGVLTFSAPVMAARKPASTTAVTLTVGPVETTEERMANASRKSRL